jgi:hypothetical protein
MSILTIPMQRKELTVFQPIGLLCGPLYRVSTSDLP